MQQSAALHNIPFERLKSAAHFIVAENPDEAATESSSNDDGSIETLAVRKEGKERRRKNAEEIKKASDKKLSKKSHRKRYCECLCGAHSNKPK